MSAGNCVHRSTDDATLPASASRVTLGHYTTTLPSVMRSRRHALPHQHARSSSSLENIIYTLNLEGRALLVSARTNIRRHALSVFARHEVGDIGRIGRWTQVGFTPNEQDWDRRPTYASNFFDPLGRTGQRSIKMARQGKKKLVQDVEPTFTDTFSRESGVSIAKAIKITCDLE